MTKKQLENYITLYRTTEDIVSQLDTDFGICIWDSKNPNFYNNYNILLRYLLEDIFGDKYDLLEEYIWEQNSISFDDLCNYLGITDETDSK